MAADPSMPLYVGDWLSSPTVSLMSPAQEGALVRLLCYAWRSQEAAVPDDDSRLAVLSRMGEGWFNGGCQLVRDCFIPHPDKPGFLTNQKLYGLWQERQEWRRKSSLGGQKSAEMRRKSSPEKRLKKTKGGSTVAQPPNEPSINSSSSSVFLSSPSSLSSENNLHPDEDGGLKKCGELDDLVNAWNLIPGVAHIRDITKSRRLTLRARLKDSSWRTNWRDGISKVTASAFCRGENDRGWKADLDWFLRPDTLTRLLEGKYDDRVEGLSHPHGGKFAGIQGFLENHRDEE